MGEESVRLGRARAAHEAAAERLLRLVQLVHEAPPSDRGGLAGLVAQAQADYDASRAALAEARASLRSRGLGRAGAPPPG